jgi:formamidase
MHDLMAGRYRVPWEDEVKVTDGSSCGFATPTRAYHGGADVAPPTVPV